MTSIPVLQRKRGPIATGQTPVTSIRLPSDIVDGLDKFSAQQPEPRPKRSAIISSALREWLAGKGLLPASDDPTVLADRIEGLEAKVASIPEHGEPSPETGMNTMKRALAEAELIGLRKRKRIRKARPV